MINYKGQIETFKANFRRLISMSKLKKLSRNNQVRGDERQFILNVIFKMMSPLRVEKDLCYWLQPFVKLTFDSLVEISGIFYH